MTEQLMACNANWLDSVTPQYTDTTGGVAYSGAFHYYWPEDYHHHYYPIFQSTPARPIKLALSEVERLRKVAKDDPKLKAILQKFTGLIEITVDFE